MANEKRFKNASMTNLFIEAFLFARCGLFRLPAMQNGWSGG